MQEREARPSRRLECHLAFVGVHVLPGILLIGMLLLAGAFAGCGHRPALVPVPAPQANLPYLNLQPGWRLSIVSSLHPAAAVPDDLTWNPVDSPASSVNASLTLEAKAPDDFGYVRAFVSLRRAGGGQGDGVRFRADSAQRHTGGVVEEIAPPEALKAMLPLQSGPARILFLTRAAEVDHDMAILQAKTQAQLAWLTEAVVSSPLESCRVSNDASCRWVPRGVAVCVERPSSADAETKEVTWVPVL